MKRDGKNVFFCVSATTEIMKTNKVPLKSPIKLLLEMIKNVFFCVSATTEIMKTNNVPLKSPIKLLPEMKKIFLKCSKFVGFKDLF